MLPSTIPRYQDDAEADNNNGKDKRSLGRSIRRFLSRNSKRIVACAAAAALSVLLVPPPYKFSAALRQLQSPPGSGSGSGSSAVRRTDGEAPAEVPECDESPWKPHEDMRGRCPGDLRRNADVGTMELCARSCCAYEDCITWQYREDTGCLQGKDVRLGMEKDGVSAWCSDHPPQKWSGQFLKPHGSKSKLSKDAVRKAACSTDTWNPNEEIGQCFGLGDVKRDGSGSAEECMRRCCESESCGAWQWNKELGCFYGKGMHSCQGGDDPMAFEPFVGRRKKLESRKYVDKHNKPWQMTL